MSSLFDILVALQPLDDLSSIREHLTRLLNARRGSLMHLPDYGLPDIGEVYQGLPYSLLQLKRAIAILIERYEPRLKRVKIAHQALTQQDDVVHLTINAELHNHTKIFFDTYFLTGGKAIIADI